MKKIMVSLLLVAAAGLAASIVMTSIHYKMGEVGMDERSFCHVSDFFDCDSVLASRYAKLGPFLNSELGILYYFLVFVGVLYAWFSGDGRSTFAYLFLSSIFAVAYSGVMAYISLAKLGVLCLLCSTTYLANLFLMILLPRALKIRCREIPKFVFDYAASLFRTGTMKPRLSVHLAATIVLVALGLVFFRGLNPEIHKAHAEVPKEQYLKFFESLPRQDIDVAGRPVWGNPEAKVTVVEFSDFQCPFCRRAAFTLKPYLKEFHKDVRFYFLNYPLDSSCNPALEHSMHPVSCMAAKAGICAQKEGKFWEYHDLVFENQKRLSRATLLELAKDVGFDHAKFEQCLASDEVSETLKKDVQQGSKVQVKGTPSVFINGRLFGDWPSPERLRIVIEAEARK